MKLTDSINIEKLLFAARFLRIVCQHDRAEIIRLITEQPGLSVNQIKDQMSLRQADTSNHLILLKKYGILTSKRQGKFRIYSVNTKTLEEIIKITNQLGNK